MVDFLIYDLRVAAWIAVFYLFYRLLLSRETFHRVNRIVLLSTTVVSFVLPLCVITLHETVVMPMPQVNVEIGDVVAEEFETTVPWWEHVLPVLFVVGMVVTLGHTFWSIFKVNRLIKRSEQHPQADGTVVCVTGNAALSPFSWMQYIVMNRSDYEQQDAAILAHERAHIRLRHSWDVLLVDTLTTLQWFNPVMWMLRMDLRTIHEYEADAVVLSQGINARQYQYLLVTKAAGIGGYSIANGISHSTLKNRITMMLHKKSNRRNYLKLLALLPIVGIALAINARTVTDYVYDETQVQQPVKKGKKVGMINAGAINEIVVVEQVPATQEESQMSTDEKFTLSGTVVDDQTKPVVGAIIIINDSKKGTVTDRDGKFQLEVSAGDQIHVSYIGYGTSTMIVNQSLPNVIIPLKKESEHDKAYDVVEEMPEFPGGMSAMMQYLAQNIKYPEEAHKKGIQGRVIATFVVEKDGSITNAKVVRSIDPQLDAEALRVVNAMPKWKPGKQGGEAVAVKYTVPVTFKLDEGPKTEDYVLEVDGKVVNDSVIGSIPPGAVESMTVEKGQNGQPKKILITTKKNK